ncbi:GNAT family N-acetyltransferase [Paenibacillus sp. TRM 82003]|nr:GNAT family N-acetyltransferase [Paenibacillus sp. TRM 82003]
MRQETGRETGRDAGRDSERETWAGVGQEDEARLVEELAANAWAPYTVQALGGWRLRATFGVTKRANSVWTAGALPAGDWLTIGEEFYRRRGMPPCFYICDSTPDGVDETLHRAGYEKIFPCFMMDGTTATVLACSADDERFEASYENEASDGWIGDFIRLEGFEPARYAAYAHIFRAIGPRKAFLRLTNRDGALVGLATAVAERGRCGISNVIVAPEQRRQGAAVQLLRACARWAEDVGADRLWLQVIESNEPAVGLYRKLGFAPLARNHYRVLEKKAVTTC